MLTRDLIHKAHGNQGNVAIQQMHSTFQGWGTALSLPLASGILLYSFGPDTEFSTELQGPVCGAQYNSACVSGFGVRLS